MLFYAKSENLEKFLLRHTTPLSHTKISKIIVNYNTKANNLIYCILFTINVVNRSSCIYLFTCDCPIFRHNSLLMREISKRGRYFFLRIYHFFIYNKLHIYCVIFTGKTNCWYCTSGFDSG